VLPGAAVLALVVGALLAGVLLGRRAARVPRAVRPLLGAVPDALGDAAMLLDGGGRVVAANAAAGRLARAPPARLAGARIEALLGPDLAALRQGVALGPASARLVVRGGAGPPVGARAVMARVSTRPPLDLAVIRPDPPPGPPPLPRPPPLAPEAEDGSAAQARAALAAMGAALREPTARASTAASMLRLLLPAAGPVGKELDRLEGALATLEQRLAAIGGGAGPLEAPRVLDLAALVQELLAGRGRAAIRIRAALAPARTRADEGRVRGALSEVLAAALAGLPAGGELAVRVEPRGAAALVELSSPAAGADPERAAIARALLGPEGGRVDVEAVPGRGSRWRIALPIATAAAIAPA
jgi:signal transduction histidine kinase